MKVVLYGATGRIGSRILDELLSRGHTVEALVRNPVKLPEQAGLRVKSGDLSSAAEIAESLDGADAVISAYAPPSDNSDEIAAVTVRFIDALKTVAGPRFIMVGGAGSLLLPDGTQLIDAPFFPEEWKAIAESHRRSLAILLASDVDWTYFSPAAFIDPGTRSGTFRVGKDELITDDDGKSRISMEDYAAALVDELEKRRHIRQRFTVGY